MLKTFLLLIFSVTILTMPAAAQFTIAGEVIDVIDGKTVIVAIPGGKVKVELQYIDVPEQAQQLSETVREHLRKLVVGKSVEYRATTLLKDRAIGRLSVKNIDISQQMLRDGAAWHIPIEESGQDKGEFVLYASLEAAAKHEKLGVWSIPGLKPARELRAGKIDNTWQKDQYASVAKRFAESEPNRKYKRQTGANPSLGNVGALANGYDPVSGTGFLGTSFLGVVEFDKASPNKTIIDISYYYKQDANNRRKGTFVFSVISMSKKWRFLERNNLIIKGTGKDIVIGKAKRTATNYAGEYSEKLVYAVSRNALEKIVNDSQVSVKINDLAATPSPTIRYLLHNLLEVTQ